MCFIADALGVRARCGDEKIQRLHPYVAGAFGHDVEELPVWLGVHLIEYHAVYIETVLGVGFRRQHLIEKV